MENNNSFGIILRSLRESRTMTQVDLAKRVGIDPSHLNKIEKGINMPSDDVLFRLADVLVADKLFTAAGRLIPIEFEEKHPKKIQIKNDIQETSIPDSLKKLKSLYYTQYKKDFEERLKQENIVRDLERIIENDRKYRINELNEIKEYCESRKALEKLENLKSNLELQFDIIYQIIKYLWLLTGSNNREGNSLGHLNAISEAWRELKVNAQFNAPNLLIDLFDIDSNDKAKIELIVDIIQQKTKKKRPSIE